MDMQSALGTVRAHLDLAAQSGDEPTRRAAITLVGTVEPAVQLALQDAAVQLAHEVSTQIAPAVVELRMSPHGLDAVVTGPADGSDGVGAADEPGAADGTGDAGAASSVDQDDVTGAPDGLPEDEGPAVRVSFRPPQQLKDRLDTAAVAEGLSLNAFLVRTLSSALDDPPQPDARTHTQARGRRNRHTGSGRVKGWYA